MATAYAAIISLMRIMEQIQQYHARQPIFLDEQQTQLQSLNGLLTFFQEFLERSYHHVHGAAGSKEMEVLGSQIADAAHAAEDIIETHIVDDIDSRSNGSDHFSLGLQKVIEDMDLIKKEAMESSKDQKDRLKDQLLPRDPAVPVSSSSPPPSGKDTTMVFEEDLNHIMEKLMSQQYSNRQLIPITGMGGIGKTTLAKTAYENLAIVEYFYLRGWVTISQQYDIREIILCLLKETRASPSENLQFHALGSQLHKHLSGRRYLIVIDDIWSIDRWDKLKVFLPDNNNGSRIIVTTRISIVASNLNSSSLYQMKLLDDDKSWTLLCRKVFVEKSCPPELVETGKIIAKNCKGLPLSIGVIGGLLAKSKLERKYWVYIAENTSTTISSNDEDRCLEIVSLSYHHLPIHLKPCFLYMGVFPEDYEIRISELIRLWVAEGFLKPSKGKIWEEVAEEYLKDLIDRNLLSVSKLGSTGNMKFCKIHDLLRDLCLREAQKERFICIATELNIDDDHFETTTRYALKLYYPHSLEGTNSKRRIALHCKSSEEHTNQDVYDFKSSPFLRSILMFDCEECLPLLVDHRLLRVLDMRELEYSGGTDLQLINSRYFKFCFDGDELPFSICMFWNLQTLVVSSNQGYIDIVLIAPSEIWKMPQLRHLIISEGFYLPDPPCVSETDEQCDLIVLENLQTLSLVLNFRITEEVVKRIPNVVKLQLRYSGDKHLSYYCLKNVSHLKRLQSLKCGFMGCDISFRYIDEFPLSLRRLTLNGLIFSWEELTTKIGSLPHLEKLKLDDFSTGEEWNPVEGHFLNLKYLEIRNSNHLERWTAESIHFPRLEHLVIYSVHNLEEIPCGIGDIASLRSIKLDWCLESVVASAMTILFKDQKSNYGNNHHHQGHLSLWVNGKLTASGDQSLLHGCVTAKLNVSYARQACL